MKKSARVLAAVGIAAVGALTAACAGASSGDGPEKVVMWGSWSGDQVDQLEEQAAAFNASQDDYEVSYVPQELVEEKLLTALTGGQVPDVVLWDRYQTSLYAPKNALMPIDEFIERDGVDTSAFYEPAMKEMVVDDETYGLPLLVDNRSLFYNKKLLQDAGVVPPTTWDELQDAAEKLTVREGGKLTQAGFDFSDPGLFNMWLAQAGGELLNADETATAFNSPEGKEVLDEWSELLDAGVYEQGFGDAGDPFAEGRLAMKYDGPWSLTTFDSVDGLEYGVVPPPVGPDGDKGAYMGGFGLVIPQGAKNAEGAWEFMKWWATQPENGVAFGKISGWIPANIEAANDPYFTEDEHYAAFIEAMSYAKTRPAVTGFSDVEGKAVVPALEKFLSGELDAQQALDEAQQQGDQILERAR